MATTMAEKQMPSGISRPPTALEKSVDRCFRALSKGFAILTIALLGFIIIQIAIPALPYMWDPGWSYLTGRVWDSNKDIYGILPEIWGTLISSLLALVIGTILGVSIAIFLSEGFLSSFIFWILKQFHVQFHPFWRSLPTKMDGLVKNLVQLLAAIPSVVYGLWGLYVVIPMLRPSANWLHENMGFIPLFGTPLMGPGLLPAAVVLAIMILPTIAAISRDSLDAVPNKIKEAAYGLGATRWEAIFGVFLPTAAPGIFGAIILGFGRALGETMALAMLAGGQNNIRASLFAPVNTLAALLATKFKEASTPQDVGLLMYAALVLLLITLFVNMLGTYVLIRSQRRFQGAR
jgi:phosphate transport system permease protein